MPNNEFIFKNLPNRQHMGLFL